MASSIMESLFQRSLDDLVKGLRLQMIGESRYLAKVLDEVKKEINSTDAATKVVALQKLTYLHMLQGSDMEWASFHVVQVMTMPKFAYKKIGYLAASQSFHEETDVLVLTTNLLRKDMGSKNEYETGMAIECLSRIANRDLASALTQEIFTMMTSGRIFVRKKATLALLRVFSKYPDAIRVAFKRLVEKMDDPDPQVVSAAVSVLCELTLRDPRSYLPLAPEFYRLLESSTSNWLSIKLVKIFGALTPLEPRLGRKIAGLLCEQMNKTMAKSLLFECIRTITLGLTDHAGAVKLAVEKLKEIMAQADPNLKYLGLQALAALMPVHPWAVADNKDTIVQCLNDGDPSIQRQSLVLIMGMISESNVTETVQVLLQYVRSTDPIFCNQLILSILSICSRACYEMISDFPWYVSVLAQIAHIPFCEHGEEVGRQLMDIALRVESVRREVVKVARDLLVDPALLACVPLQGVLCAAAWVAGEYVALAPLGAFELLEALLQPGTRLLPMAIHAVYLQAVLKVFVFIATACYQDSSLGQQNNEHGSSQFLGEGSLEAAVVLIISNVTPLVNSVNMEVQERACNLLGLLQALEKPTNSEDGERWRDEGFGALEALNEVFGVELGPVSVHAQGRVVVPEGLDVEDNLDALGPIGDYDEILLEAGEKRPTSVYREWDAGFVFTQQSNDNPSLADASAALLAQHRHRHENYYLPTDAVSRDYPPPHFSSANTPTTPEAAAPSTSLDSSMLGESSQLWTKPRQTKARRPVVVKLDDEDDMPELSAHAKKKGLKDELLASAIRDALATDESKQRVDANGLESAHRGHSSRRHRHGQHSTKHPENGSKHDGSGPSQPDKTLVGQRIREEVHEGKKQTSDVSRKEQGRNKYRPSKHEIMVLEDGLSSNSENEREGTFELKENARWKKKQQKQRHSHRQNQYHARSSVPTQADSVPPIPDFLL